MSMEKYHLEDQKLSWEKLSLAMQISLREQASNYHVEAKLNEKIYKFGKRINLEDQLIGGQVYMEA